MLPKIEVPIYDLQLLSIKDKIKFRPFSVKEEKLFLMAQEAEDDGKQETILNTVKQVVNNCLVTELNIDNLPTFDLEYLFLNLRAKSVGEEVELSYNCNNTYVKEVDGKKEEIKCRNVVKFMVNLLEIKPEYGKNHDLKIPVDEKLGIMMKYPSVSTVVKHAKKTESQALFDIIVDSVDYIYDKEEIYYSKDTPRKEIEEFIETIPSDKLENIKNFFETMPKIKHLEKFSCNKCGYEENLEIEGIENFFV